MVSLFEWQQLFDIAMQEKRYEYSDCNIEIYSAIYFLIVQKTHNSAPTHTAFFHLKTHRYSGDSCKNPTPFIKNITPFPKQKSLPKKVKKGVL